MSEKNESRTQAIRGYVDGNGSGVCRRISGVQSWQSCDGASDMHPGSCRSCGAAFCRGCLRAFTAQMAPPMKSGRSIWH